MRLNILMPGFDTELSAFRSAFDDYRQWNRRLPGDIIRTRAARMSYKLNRAWQAIAKSRGQLREEIAALGYAIKRRPDPKNPGKSVDTGTEIDARIHSLKFLSVSFLYKEWRNRQQAPEGVFDAMAETGRVGEATVKTADTSADPYAMFMSFLTGVVLQDERRGITATLLRDEVTDMYNYINSKVHAEELASHLNRAFEVPVAL
jgi:hypothetical protein